MTLLRTSNNVQSNGDSSSAKTQLHQTIRKTTKRTDLHAANTVGTMAHVGLRVVNAKTKPTIIKQQQPSTKCLGVFGANLDEESNQLVKMIFKKSDIH